MPSPDLVILLKPDGTVSETHAIALTGCPYQYAARLAHRHKGQDEFGCLIEASGERLGPYSADEIISRAFLKEMFDAKGP